MTRGLSSPSRGEQTRTAILQAAHDLFIEQGYHGTSMRQVAAGAGVALGGLYNHFDSKEEVFEAVFMAYHPYHQVFPLILESQGDNLETLLKDALHRMVEAVEGRTDFMNLMFIELVEFKSVHMLKMFATLMPKGMEILQHLVQSYPDQMRLIPSPMVLRTFLGLFIGYYLTETAIGATAAPEFKQNALEHFIDIYLNGILAAKSA